MFSCPDYPDGDEIYEAPSVCLEQYLTIVMMMKNGQKPVNPAVIATGNYSEYCYEECYQNYVDQTEAYNQNCAEYISEEFKPVSETLVAFRGIACGETNYTDQDNVNCYDQLTAKQAQSAGNPNPSPLSDYTCTIYEGAYNNICMGFQDGCCFPNQAVMLGQSLMSPVPPCFNKNCKDIAPVLDMCDRHINYATGSIEMSVYLDFAPPSLPSMYVNTSVLMFQGGLLAPLGLLPTKAAVYDFTYFDSDGNPITANNPDAYQSAMSGNFSVLITLVDTSLQELESYHNQMASPEYAQGLQIQVYNNSGPVSVETGEIRFYDSDQIYVDSAAFSAAPSTLWQVFAAVFLSLYFIR